MIPLARREMIRAAQWYDRKGTGLGDRFLDEVTAGFRAIAEFPAAHPMILKERRRWLLQSFPYGVIYRIEDETIVIVVVANLKRRPRFWARRK